jgi:uncharacterized membrane protein YbhN (UPF0104 family)
MPDDKAKLKYRYIAKLLVAVVLITYLIYSCNLKFLIMTLSRIDINLACLVFIMSLLFFFCGALNLWLLVRSMHRIPFGPFMHAYVYGYAVNLFTPGQLGDISMAFILKKYGIYYSRSTLAYGVDKVITMLFILFTGYIGATFLLKNFIWPKWIFAIPVICAMGAMACIWLMLYIPCNDGYVGRLKQFIKNIYAESLLWNGKFTAIALNIALTIIKWLILSVTYYLAFLAFGIDAKWPEVGIIPIISTLVGYIPVSIGGIGTVELCAVYLFSLISIDRVYVLDVYIILRVIAYFQAGVVLGLCNRYFGRARIFQGFSPRPAPKK